MFFKGLEDLKRKQEEQKLKKRRDDLKRMEEFLDSTDVLSDQEQMVEVGVLYRKLHANNQRKISVLETEKTELISKHRDEIDKLRIEQKENERLSCEKVKELENVITELRAKEKAREVDFKREKDRNLCLSDDINRDMMNKLMNKHQIEIESMVPKSLYENGMRKLAEKQFEIEELRDQLQKVKERFDSERRTWSSGTSNVPEITELNKNFNKRRGKKKEIVSLAHLDIVKSLKDKINLKDREIVALRKDSNNLKTKYSGCENEVIKLKGECSGLKLSLESSVKKIKSLESSNKLLESRNQDLNQTLITSNSEIVKSKNASLKIKEDIKSSLRFLSDPSSLGRVVLTLYQKHIEKKEFENGFNPLKLNSYSNLGLDSLKAKKIVREIEQDMKSPLEALNEVRQQREYIEKQYWRQQNTFDRFRNKSKISRREHMKEIAKLSKALQQSREEL